jgi:hypothetical protein
MDKLGPQLLGASAQQVIKLWSWRVEGVSRKMAFDILEAEVEARTTISDKERRAWFAGRHRCHTIFDAELAKDGHHSGDE